jgi:hypothetical protein
MAVVISGTPIVRAIATCAPEAKASSDMTLHARGSVFETAIQCRRAEASQTRLEFRCVLVIEARMDVQEESLQRADWVLFQTRSKSDHSQGL